jgi:tetratricopeptide (TPR) repeat protein
VLEGSVRKAGQRVRITTQLIDAATEAHIWADRFDGTVAEAFELQDEVATSVVGAIAPRLQEAEIERARLKPTEDLTAYDYYLRGVAVAHRDTREANETALRLFAKVVERDPHFAPPYAVAADLYTFRKMNGWMIDREQETAETERLARRAIELGRDDPVALVHSGLALCYVLGKLDDGAACIDRAVALNSNLAIAWSASGWIRISYGHPDVGIEHIVRAMRLSPFDPQMYQWQTGAALGCTCAGRYDEGAVWAEKALQDQPGHTGALRMAIVCHVMAGRLLEAQRLMARLRGLAPDLRISNLAEVMPPFRRSEDSIRVIEGLRKAGLPE